MLTRRSLALGAAAGGALAAVSGSARAETARFPLSLASGQRYMRDANGAPFLLIGDAAWSLIVQISREDMLAYLDDRKARGFNTILVNLIEHRFASHPPRNFYGDAPFAGDVFGAPNEKYFEHADFVIRSAEERGILVLLAPAYLGTQGGPEGFYADMVRVGAERLRPYGRYVGQRFAARKNILWVAGGDYNPPNKDVVRAVVAGIRETDRTSLITVHAGDGSAALDYWSGESWLQLNNVYSYAPVFESALEQYARGAPFFLMESAYENEHDAGEWRVRMQAYQAILSGGCGEIFGNAPIWHFSTPGMGNGPWRDALRSRGAQSMTYLARLFSGLAWWTLAPDNDKRLLVAGEGASASRALAALGDGFAIVYVPSVRDLTISARSFAGRVGVQWFDPSSGALASDQALPAGATRVLRPPGSNAAGLGDWVLLLRGARA